MVISCCIGTLRSLFKIARLNIKTKIQCVKKQIKHCQCAKIAKKNRSTVKPGPIRSARSCCPSPERTLKLKSCSCSIIGLMVEQPNSKTNGRPWGIVYSVQCVCVYIYIYGESPNFRMEKLCFQISIQPEMIDSKHT